MVIATHTDRKHIHKQEKLDGLAEQAEIYFSFADKSELSNTEQLSLKIGRQTLQSNNISDRSDFERLEAVCEETDKKLQSSKKLSRTAREYTRCTGILLILIILLLRGITFISLLRNRKNISLKNQILRFEIVNTTAPAAKIAKAKIPQKLLSMTSLFTLSGAQKPIIASSPAV